MEQPKIEFMDVARFVLALIIVVGGGAMVWFGRVAEQTIWAVIGMVLGFYFGSASTSAVTRAATNAVMRALTDK